MANDGPEEPKPLDVRISELEDAVSKLSARLEPTAGAPVALCRTCVECTCGPCSECSVCSVCAICRACSVCSICRICQTCFECSCGPCLAR